MKRTLGTLGCLVALLGFVGPALAGSAARQKATAVRPTDQSLDERIENRLHKDATLKKYDLKVEVDAGVAKLTGTVATKAQKMRASRLATTKGVTRVNNEIMVNASAAKKTSV